MNAKKPSKKQTQTGTKRENSKLASEVQRQAKCDLKHADAPKSKKRKVENVDDPPTEKRLRRHRSQPPQAYQVILDRALSQRFVVLDRCRTGTPSNPEETIEIAGTTGNIYTVKINKIPSCDCPYALKGHQCKHIIYIMKRTLRARDELVYQLALLSTEVEEIFSQAPPIPKEKGAADAKDASDAEDPRRKPVTDDCPICCADFDLANEEIVWCKAACGNNAHKECFETWAKMKRAQNAEVTCPFCRTPWPDDELMQSINKKSAPVGLDGYRNVAHNLGLSGARDYSTYHPFWVRTQSRLRPEEFLDD